MGINERKEREKERRRNEIIDAAKKIFFEKGIQNATMDDVASTAELSKGTLYLYFKSKEEIYLALSLRGMQIMTDMFKQAALSKTTGLEKIEALGFAYFNFARQHPGFYDALMYYEMKDHDTVKPLSEAHQCRMQGDDSMNILIQTIELGIQDGSLRPDLNIEQTAMFLWAASMGMVQLLTTKGKHLEECHGIPMKQMENITFDLIKKAIGATS